MYMLFLVFIWGGSWWAIIEMNRLKGYGKMKTSAANSLLPTGRHLISVGLGKQSSGRAAGAVPGHPAGTGAHALESSWKRGQVGIDDCPTVVVDVIDVRRPVAVQSERSFVVLPECPRTDELMIFLKKHYGVMIEPGVGGTHVWHRDGRRVVITSHGNWRRLSRREVKTICHRLGLLFDDHDVLWEG